MLTSGKRKVILFLPPYSGKVLGPPLGLLCLAGALRESEYQPVIIDGALDPDYMMAIRRHIRDAVCFGVSLLTGPMIRQAMDVSRVVRSVRPDLPIIYGGWHPSLLTAQTLREDFVDVVVRHQGEKTLIEVLNRVAAGAPLDMVSGCWFKKNGEIIQNPDRAASAISSLPAPAYDMVDFDAYERETGTRKLPYATSIGCPYACNYCTDMVFYNRRFNAYEVNRVVDEVTHLVRTYRLQEIALVDSNFLVDVRRAVALARGFIDSGVKFRWTFQASTDLLCRMSDGEVELLAESGVSHIGFGTESAAPEVLRLMNKQHQHIPDIHEATRKCARAGIRVTLNLIFGYPGEGERHRCETLRVMTDVAARFQNVTFSPNIFTPYPGIPIWPELRAAGVAEPESLEGWTDVDLGSNNLPWLRGPVYKRLERAVSYFLLDAELKKMRRRLRSAPGRSALGLLSRLLYWRLRHYRFEYPFELWLSAARKWLAVRRSLLTGQVLSHDLERAR